MHKIKHNVMIFDREGDTYKWRLSEVQLRINGGPEDTPWTDILAAGPIVKERGMLARRAVIRGHGVGTKYVVHYESVSIPESPCTGDFQYGTYTNDLAEALDVFDQRNRKLLGIGREEG